VGFNRVRGLADWLALNRDMAVMVVAVFLITAGNQLWTKYMPKYLAYLGAGIWVIGFYGFMEQFLGAVYQYPGGLVADRLGAKRALVFFTLVSALGYAVFLLADSWQLILVGTVLALIWESMSSPAIFALIGDVLPRDKRAMGFSVQSILKRLPIIVAPPLGGYLIEVYGYRGGMRIGFAVSIVAALAAAFLQEKFYTPRTRRSRGFESPFSLWPLMPASLKKLLVSDVLARMASYMVKVYVVLYVLDVLGATPVMYGLLVSLQMAAAISSYLPAAKLADTYGRGPFISATFAAFSLFPLALALTTSPGLLPAAFLIAGLREIGEPARKALIVDLSGEAHRGKVIGLYYLIRESVTMPAPLIGAALWALTPRLPFYAAFLVGSLSLAFFLATRPDREGEGAEDKYY